MRYRIRFADGTNVLRDAATADEARENAARERQAYAAGLNGITEERRHLIATVAQVDREPASASPILIEGDADFVHPNARAMSSR